jgi:NAD+ kinase
MFPSSLVLVRHGESEINVAKNLSKRGDESKFTPEFRSKHQSAFCLTDKGREQAMQTGEWIKNNFPGMGRFDRYLVSPYTRAKETAAYMMLTDALWAEDHKLVERDWGKMECRPSAELKHLFSSEQRAFRREPFYTRLPEGESFAQECSKVELVLEKLRRDWGGKRVIIVCHGEVMQAFRFVLEHIPIELFKKLIGSEAKEDIVFNGQIIHYSCRDPENDNLYEEQMWVQMIRPTENPVWVSEWKKIPPERLYTNEELF